MKILTVPKKHIQAIVGQDCGSHEVFILNTKTSQYAWNIAPIDDTDVVCSFEAVGREFKYPLDTELLSKPTLNPDNNQGFLKYLQDVYMSSQLSISVLEYII